VRSFDHGSWDKKDSATTMLNVALKFGGKKKFVSKLTHSRVESKVAF
jgi:hypothetical protein